MPFIQLISIGFDTVAVDLRRQSKPARSFTKPGYNYNRLKQTNKKEIYLQLLGFEENDVCLLFVCCLPVLLIFMSVVRVFSFIVYWLCCGHMEKVIARNVNLRAQEKYNYPKTLSEFPSLQSHQK